MYMAELAYQASPTTATLERWDRVLTATADYMASYAWKNESTGKYDLGPPFVTIPLETTKRSMRSMRQNADKDCRSYGVTENTPPLSTHNLAYEVSVPLRGGSQNQGRR